MATLARLHLLAELGHTGVLSVGDSDRSELEKSGHRLPTPPGLGDKLRRGRARIRPALDCLDLVPVAVHADERRLGERKDGAVAEGVDL